MTQTELMITVMRMKAGQRINIAGHEMREAVDPSLTLDEFLKQIRENWSMDAWELMGSDVWVITKC